MYAIKFDFEKIDKETLQDQVVDMIENYPYGSGEIDYFQSIDELVGMSHSSNNQETLSGQELREKFINGLVDRLCAEYYAEKVSPNKVKFTLENIEKYFSKNMDEAIDFIKKFKNDVSGFVMNHYHLTHSILDEEFPKYYSEYAYLEGEAEFIRTIYNKMRYDRVNEIEVEILDVWDFHL